jgi:diguanylate cyclase (GGDEF)-like protein
MININPSPEERRPGEGAPDVVVLVVEDDPAQAQGLAEMLRLESGGRDLVHTAGSMKEAEALLERVGVDAIILDLDLPDCSGLTTISRIKDSAPDVPVVVLTGVDDDAVTREAARRGIHGYFAKGAYSPSAIQRMLYVALERRRHEEEMETDKARLERQLKRDPLTGALNRRGLQAVLEREWARSRRGHGALLAVLLDLDDFKAVNDEHGHAVGDAVLVELVSRVGTHLRRTDSLSRVGGDEFVVLLPETRPAEGRVLAERIRRGVSDRPFDARDGLVEVTASLGLFEVTGDSIDEILLDGGLALRLSKTAGKNRVSVLGAESLWTDVDPAELTRIVRALQKKGEIRVRAAPIVAVRDGGIVGYELLAHCGIPGFESPLEFFELARRAERLAAIDLRCFRLACEAISRVPEGHQVHLNLRPETLAQASPLSLYHRCAGHIGARRVYIDISESEIVGNPSYLEEPVARLRAAGLRIVLDDVGWDLGSLESLVLLRPDVVKLRPGLLRSGVCRGDQSVQRLIEVCRRLGAVLVGKGVDSSHRRDHLAELGVELAQGPHWPWTELEQLC